ncbi:unnamed protein product, partial [Phaeothamnion confervicola]
MSDYLHRLVESADACGNVLCLGLDPDPKRITAVEKGTPLEACKTFIDRVLDGILEAGLRPAALKPNLAYFEQFGSGGLAWLESLLEKRREICPIILDAKRGDIGASSQAYAKAIFDVWGADAVTVSPWMGFDSVEPFVRPGKGVYILLRTSNPGSSELQTVKTDAGLPMWETLLGTALNKWRKPGLGAVVGATRPEALRHLMELLKGHPFPLLIPGVGSQGGEAEQVMSLLPGQRGWHRVNVSSAILYACEKTGGKDYAESAVDAFR